MATVGPPPPPPPGGPGKTPDFGHKVSKAIVPIQKIRDRYDGKSPQTARPTNEIIKNPNQAQYLVHVLTEKPPAKWQKCSNGEARYFAETGYPVFEIRKGKAYRVQLVPVQQPGSWDSAAGRQFQEVVQEEVDRVARHEYLPGEDIMDDDGSIVSSGGSSSDAESLFPGFRRLTLGSSPPGRSPFGPGSQPPSRPGSQGHRSPPSSRPGTATSPPRGGDPRSPAPSRPSTAISQSGGPRSPTSSRPGTAVSQGGGPQSPTSSRPVTGTSAGQREGPRSPPSSRPGTASSDQRPSTPRDHGSGPAGSPPQGQGPLFMGSKGKGPRRDGPGGGAAST